MLKILIISLSDLNNDARVSRQVNYLCTKHRVTVASFCADNEQVFDFIKLAPSKLTILKKIIISGLLVLKIFKPAHNLLHSYPELEKIHQDFDLIIVNDIETLSLALALKGKAKLIFDAHEYFPRQFEDKWMWRMLFQPLNTYLCKQCLSKVDAMTTIGEGIALEYEKQFKVKPIVTTNAASYHEINPSKTSEDKINLIHHGIAIPSRRLELMIEMMNYLDERFHLHLMLLTPPTANSKTRNYFKNLKDSASNHPRITFVDPVKTNEIVTRINKYDIGIILVPPINFNYKNGLGNKFFDFIQSRLAICIGPIPEMAKAVQKYNMGIVSKNFTPRGLAMEMNLLTNEKVDYFKMNSARAAKEINAEVNNKILDEIISELFPEKKLN